MSIRKYLFAFSLGSSFLAGTVSANEAFQKGDIDSIIGINIAGGNKRKLGKADIFIPFAQDDTTLSFLDLRLSKSLPKKQKDFKVTNMYEGNLGLGYRFLVGDSQVAGFTGYLDYLHKETNAFKNNYKAITLNGHFLTDTWHLNLNGYIPVGNTKGKIGNSDTPTGRVKLVNPRVLSEVYNRKNNYEQALKGVDVRVSNLVPGFENIRAGVTGYGFFGPKTKSINGLGLNAEIELNKYVSLEASFSHDKVRKFSGLVGFRVSAPLSGSHRDYNKLEKLFATRVYRDIDIVTNKSTADTQEVVTKENPNLKPILGRGVQRELGLLSDLGQIEQNVDIANNVRSANASNYTFVYVNTREDFTLNSENSLKGSKAVELFDSNKAKMTRFIDQSVALNYRNLDQELQTNFQNSNNAPELLLLNAGSYQGMAEFYKDKIVNYNSLPANHKAAIDFIKEESNVIQRGYISEIIPESNKQSIISSKPNEKDFLYFVREVKNYLQNSSSTQHVPYLFNGQGADRAGVMVLRKDPGASGNYYVLLGVDRNSLAQNAGNTLPHSTWASGSSEQRDGDILTTAVRESFEETSGFMVVTKEELEKLTQSNSYVFSPRHKILTVIKPDTHNRYSLIRLNEAASAANSNASLPGSMKEMVEWNEVAVTELEALAHRLIANAGNVNLTNPHNPIYQVKDRNGKIIRVDRYYANAIAYPAFFNAINNAKNKF